MDWILKPSGLPFPSPTSAPRLGPRSREKSHPFRRGGRGLRCAQALLRPSDLLQYGLPGISGHRVPFTWNSAACGLALEARKQLPGGRREEADGQGNKERLGEHQ